MHSKGGNIVSMINDKTDKIVKDLFESFCSTY